MDKNCIVCSISFKLPASKSERKYCSLRCFGIAHKSGMYSECSYCKQEFWVEPGKVNVRKFCSWNCNLGFSRDTDRRIVKTETCWIWTGTRDRQGYGTLKYDYKLKRAHRFVYELNKGAVPTGKVLDHLCRNTSCVNPDHLEPVTVRENVLRGVGVASINSKKTHCIRGHEFNELNTEIRKSGSRRCLACRKLDYKRRGETVYG